MVLGALLEEPGHETGVPRNLAEPHALSGVEAGVARVRGRDADDESAEVPLSSRGSQDVSRTQARRGLKEAQHLRLGSWVRDHSGGQDDVAHFVVARSRRPGRTAQGVLVEAAAGQLATRVALRGEQATVRAEADRRRVDDGVLLKVARGPRVELPRPLMGRGLIAQIGDAARDMPGLRAVFGREPLRQFGDGEVIDHGLEAVLQALRSRRGGVLCILDARLDK